MIVVEILSYLLISAGVVFLLAAAFGLVVFPDFYARLHAGGKGDTLGQLLVLLGLALASGLTLVSFKLGLIAFFLFILNPTATHALARGAWVCGVRPLLQGDEPFVQREGQMTADEQESLLERESANLPGTASPEVD